jgi:hypothetical protein
MDLIDQIKELSSAISKRSERLETEEATKTAQIMPFIKALGYDVFNPEEVVPEFTCDFGTKKGEKVDYAIMKDKKPIMLFECKSANTNLDEVHASQLYRYFSVTEVKVGVLTNGIIYKFYSDLEKANTLDAKPFLELDLLNLKEPMVEELKRFRKESFETDEIVSAASEMKYMKEIKRILGEELDSPSEAFVKFFTKQVYAGMIRKTAHEKFTGIVHHAFKEFINDEISDRLTAALERGNGTKEVIDVDKNDEEDTDDGIVTTEEEIEGFHIVRAILHEITDPERVVLADRKNYCNVLLDNRVRKPICRFYFDHKQKYVGFFDENKVEEKVQIDKLSTLYNYAEKLKAIIGYYDENTSYKAMDDFKEEKVEPWKKTELLLYLKDTTPYQRLFLASLVQVDEELAASETITFLMNEIAKLRPSEGIDEKITGQAIAGARSGLSKRRITLKKEDIIESSREHSERDYVYGIKSDYKQIVIDWVKEEGLWMKEKIGSRFMDSR